jgi:hypothetical protein
MIKSAREGGSKNAVPQAGGLFHRKILLDASVLGTGAYADAYTAPPGTAPRPLVVYVGGAISEAEYERRRETPPEPVRAEFQTAAGPQPEADLLVCPFPPPSRTPSDGGAPSIRGPDGVEVLPDTAWQSLLRKRFLFHLVGELLRARKAPLPTSLSFVGFSAGAYLAVGLALDLPRGRGAAIVGGTGMAEALAQSPPESGLGRSFLAIAGEKDPLAPRTGEWERLLRRRGLLGECRSVPAGHSFAEYAGCGALRDAFGFAHRLAGERAEGEKTR